MKLKEILKNILPFYKGYRRMANSGNGVPISPLKYVLHIFGLYNRNIYWYKPKSHWIGKPKRIYVGKNSSVGRENNFYQAFGGIFIGDYVRIARNVSLLTSNHDIYNHSKSHHKPIIIHNYCWIGMNTSILAGVELGPRTIVATGAVVNKSFPEGFCILGGVPAKIVKRLDPNLFDEQEYESKYNSYGYLSADKVEQDPHKLLNEYLDPDFFEIINGKIQLKQNHI